MQSNPETTKISDPKVNEPAPPEAKAPEAKAPEAAPADALPATKIDTVNTEMLNEILDQGPVWRRSKVLSLFGAAALVAVLGYWYPGQASGAKDSTLLPSEQKENDATFEATNDDDDGADSMDGGDLDGDDQSMNKPELTPVPKELAAAGAMASGLAFAGKASEVPPSPAMSQEKAPSLAMSQEKAVSPARPVAVAAQATLKAEAKPVSDVATVPTIHFAYRSARLSASTKAALDQLAAKMKSDKALKLRIEGNADERGSERYNYRLGLHRAQAAKAYLMAKGVSTKRLFAVSFGKSRPLTRGHDEKTWAQNRRVELRTATMLLSRR